MKTKRILSIVLTLFLLLSAVPIAALPASAAVQPKVYYREPVYMDGNYINGVDSWQEDLYVGGDSGVAYTLISDKTERFEMSEGTYVLGADYNGDGVINGADAEYGKNNDKQTTFTFAKGFSANGDISLILADGFTLNVNGSNSAADGTEATAVVVSAGVSLTIYGQANDAGKLVANSTAYSGYWVNMGANAIDVKSEAKLTMNGGTVTAKGGCPYNEKKSVCGDGIKCTYDAAAALIFNGGIVNANGGSGLDSITNNSASGGNGISGSIKSVINGGTVNAVGGAGTGLNAGGTGIKDIVTFNGGDITAMGGAGGTTAGTYDSPAGGSGISIEFKSPVTSSQTTVAFGENAKIKAQGGSCVANGYPGYGIEIKGSLSKNSTFAVEIDGAEVTAKAGNSDGTPCSTRAAVYMHNEDVEYVDDEFVPRAYFNVNSGKVIAESGINTQTSASNSKAFIVEGFDLEGENTGAKITVGKCMAVLAGDDAAAAETVTAESENNYTNAINNNVSYVSITGAHSFTNYSSNGDADCTHDGTKTAVCDTCGIATDTIADEGSALDHDYVDHDAKAPTCVSVGWDAYRTCTRCDYTTYSEIPAKGHSYGDVSYLWNGSVCTAARICSDCQETTEGHAETEIREASYVEDTAADCVNASKGHYEVTFENTALGAARTEAGTAISGKALGHKDENSDNYCDECGTLLVPPVTVTNIAKNGLKLNVVSGSAYTENGAKDLAGTVITEEDGQSTAMSPNQMLCFTVEVPADFHYKKYRVLAGDTELIPDENGVYTVTIGTEDVVVRVEGVETLTIWQQIKLFFKSVIEAFTIIAIPFMTIGK